MRWETGAAQFVVDDDIASEPALAVGQVVRIEGTRTSASAGSATRVESDDLVKGVIESIDSAAELTVLGQTIRVDDSTRFDPDIVLDSIDGLSLGQFIEVSGFLGSGGVVTATYIELGDDDDDSELTGFVTNLDTGALTFEINGITVDYSAAGSIDRRRRRRRRRRRQRVGR